MQSRLWQTLTLTFYGFLVDRMKTKTNLWMDLWMLTEETLESDTKMIWGGPIFSVSGGAMVIW